MRRRMHAKKFLLDSLKFSVHNLFYNNKYL